MMVMEGDSLPVSALPEDGTFPSATTQYEKRNIAIDIPVWDPSLCIQCGKCVLVCPHAAIRSKVYDKECLKEAPAAFKHAEAKFPNFKGCDFTVQIAPEDCTGCGLCAHNCPINKTKPEDPHRPLILQPQMPLREQERKNWNYFLELPEADKTKLNTATVKDVQLLRPLFEFSGLRGLRRNPLPQTPLPALRRPRSDSQRHRLLLHLRRQPAHHPVVRQRRRQRSGVEQLPL